MKTGGKIFVWTALGLGITAIIVYATQLAQMSKKLFYKFEGVKVKQAKLDGVILGVKMGIENKGRLEANVEGYNLNIFANNKFVTNVTTHTPFAIKPFETALIEFDATLNPQSFGSIIYVLTNSQSMKGITLTTDGTITIRKFGLPFRIPVSYTETVSDYI